MSEALSNNRSVTSSDAEGTNKHQQRDEGQKQNTKELDESNDDTYKDEESYDDESSNDIWCHKS